MYALVCFCFSQLPQLFHSDAPTLVLKETEEEGPEAGALPDAKLHTAQALVENSRQYSLRGVDKLTIVMPGFARRAVLVQTVQHYCSSLGSVLDRVIIVWNNMVCDGS